MSSIPALLSMREIFWPEKRVAPDTFLQSSMSVQCRTSFGNFLIRKETVEVVMFLSRLFFSLFSLERLKPFSKDAIPFGLVLGTGGS